MPKIIKGLAISIAAAILNALPPEDWQAVLFTAMNAKSEEKKNN